MATLTGVVVLHAPPAAVAAVVLDWNHDARWRPGVRFETSPAGPAVTGQRLVEHLRIGRRNVTTPIEVTTVEPGRTAAFTGGGRGLRVSGRRTVEPTSGSTSVRIELTLTLTGAAAPLSPLVGAAYRRRFRAELRHLARLPELGRGADRFG